jgi:hypothetical protein
LELIVGPKEAPEAQRDTLDEQATAGKNLPVILEKQTLLPQVRITLKTNKPVTQTTKDKYAQDN